MRTHAKHGLLLLTLLLIGCGKAGPRLVDVTGSVKVGGKPAEGAMLFFHAEDESLSPASAVAEKNGSFSVMYNGEKGIPVGKYRVTLTWPDPSKKPTESQIMMGTAEAGPDLLKGKYSSKSSTNLSVEISSNTKSLEPFDL